jgi:hypothetical protein
MSAPVVGMDPAAVATSVRTKSDAVNSLYKQAVADLKPLLTVDQLKKLPAGILDVKP